MRRIRVIAVKLTVRGNNSVEDIQCRYLFGNACKRPTTFRTLVRNSDISLESFARVPRMCQICSPRACARFGETKM